MEVYLNAAGDQERQMTQLGSGRLLAPASRVLEVKAGQTTVALYLTDGETWTSQEEAVGRAAVNGNTIELELPKSVLGEAGNGNMIPMQVVLRDKEAVLLNEDAPLAIQYFSFEPLTSVLLIQDPEGDDYGPGTYTYPTDGVFKAGDFDLTEFEVSSDGANIYFSFTMKAPITNGWGSPNGFSVQTFDVYIDKDPGAGTGNRMLLPGRNAALQEGSGWDVAVWVEGWTPQVVVPGEDPMAEPVKDTAATSAMKVYVDPAKNAVIASAPPTSERAALRIGATQPLCSGRKATRPKGSGACEMSIRKLKPTVLAEHRRITITPASLTLRFRLRKATIRSPG